MAPVDMVQTRDLDRAVWRSLWHQIPVQVEMLEILGQVEVARYRQTIQIVMSEGREAKEPYILQSTFNKTKLIFQN